MVKVKVLVCELNSQTTVAVENWPVSTPVTVMVSARTVAPALAITKSAASEKINLPNRDMQLLLVLVLSRYTRTAICTWADVDSGGEILRAMANSLSVCAGDNKSRVVRGQSMFIAVTESPHSHHAYAKKQGEQCTPPYPKVRA